MAFGIVVARHLTVRQFGIFSYTTSIVFLLLVFTDLGITSLMVREMARAPDLSRRVMRSCAGAACVPWRRAHGRGRGILVHAVVHERRGQAFAAHGRDSRARARRAHT